MVFTVPLNAAELGKRFQLIQLNPETVTSTDRSVQVSKLSSLPRGIICSLATTGGTNSSTTPQLPRRGETFVQLRLYKQQGGSAVILILMQGYFHAGNDIIWQGEQAVEDGDQLAMQYYNSFTNTPFTMTVKGYMIRTDPIQ